MTEKEALRVALWHMVDKFKPFTLRPVGGAGSAARAEQDEQIAAYKRAVEALAFRDSGAVVGSIDQSNRTVKD